MITGLEKKITDEQRETLEKIKELNENLLGLQQRLAELANDPRREVFSDAISYKTGQIKTVTEGIETLSQDLPQEVRAAVVKVTAGVIAGKPNKEAQQQLVKFIEDPSLSEKIKDSLSSFIASAKDFFKEVIKTLGNPLEKFQQYKAEVKEAINAQNEDKLGTEYKREGEWDDHGPKGP